jgi:eukaryotic-like serine/threonine-protein kinase
VGLGANGTRLEPGTRLDRYELLCPVAHGGMASVWLARLSGKHGFEKLFAIKTILPEFAEDVRFQQMFLDEARIASRIEHANVAQVLDLGEEHGILYLVMQWVDGDSLSRLSRAANRQRIKIPTPIVLRILADTCGGLHAAHEVKGSEGEPLGVVHRDVSPQNILVTPEGVAKLIDFGVVKAFGRLSEDTVAGQLKGKIHYMAREQALGDQVDRRADVWSVAAVAYALIAGAPPYEGANDLATLHMLTSGRPPPPLPPGVPQPVAEAILSGLVPDPNERTQTALDLQRAFENAMLASNSVASTADVGVFACKLLVEQHQSRRRALEAALRAAEERRSLAEGLKPIGSDSSSGVGGPLSGRASVLAPTSTVSRPPSRSGAVGNANLTPGSHSEPAWPWSEPRTDLPLAASSVSRVGSVPSVQSSATLGSANSEVELGGRRRRLPGLWIGGLVGVGSIVAALILLARPPKSDIATQTMAAPPQPVQSVPPTPEPATSATDSEADTARTAAATTPSRPPPAKSLAGPDAATSASVTQGKNSSSSNWKKPATVPQPSQRAAEPSTPAATAGRKDYGF